MFNEDNYLTNIPYRTNDFGLSKVLAVRREVIHIKHILTEVFVRKSVNIQKYLEYLNIDIYYYMELMTNRLRNVHHFSRSYYNDPNDVVKLRRTNIFPVLELLDGLRNVIVLDFDGVVTENKFRGLYELCLNRTNVEICSANPTITNDWFIKNDMQLPNKIHSMKGKLKKIKQLIEIQKRFDYVFYIDNEIEYLEFAWILGIQTYLWNGNKIIYFTLKTE